MAVNAVLDVIRVSSGPAVFDCSQLAGVIRVFHGPVVYRDEPGRWLWHDVRSQDRGHVMEFLSAGPFAYQKEYRFVVSRPGYRPAGEEVFVQNTADLRAALAACVPVR